MLEGEGVAELGELGMVLRVAGIIAPGNGEARVVQVPYSRRECCKGTDGKGDVLFALEAVDGEDKVCRVCWGEVFFLFCILVQQREMSVWWVDVDTRVYDSRGGSYAGEGLYKDCARGV